MTNVGKFYYTDEQAQRWVLTDINYKVGAGELCVLFGPNGCGKTTLLRIIAGLINPDSGEIDIDGSRPVLGSGALLFQNFVESLFPWRTALGNLEFAMTAQQSLSRLDSNEERIKEVAREVGIAFPLTAKTYELSIGQQQLLALARVLIQGAPLLLLDEPFSALDHRTRRALQEWLPRYVESKGVTAIVVTHDLDEAILLGRRILLLPRDSGQRVSEIVPNLPPLRDRNLLTTQEVFDVRAAILKYYDR